MRITPKLEAMKCVRCCPSNGVSPIPQEGEYDELKEVNQVNGFSHGVGTCALNQGACKLTLNVKMGIIQEVLTETIGCSGMTHSASMVSEILPGKTILEALNTDLACDAIHVAMREIFLAFVYGRSQTAFSCGGLAVGAGMDDLGAGHRSQVGTAYGTIQRGPRFLELTEGYIRSLALDKENMIIGYRFVHLGQMMELIENGIEPGKALDMAGGTYGRYQEGITFINPRKE